MGLVKSWETPGSTLLDGIQAAGSQPSFGSEFIQTFGEGMTVVGPITAILGAATSAIGSFYAVQSQQNQLKMQAQNLRFQAEMGRINRRAAEFSAQQIGLAGQQQAGRYTMAAGQARASARAGLAARGATLGQGSAQEIIASMDVVKEIDRLNISAATIRQQEAARMQAVNLGIGATMADVSASGLQGMAGALSPGLGLSTSLLGSAAQIGGTWARNRRIEELLAGVSTARI